MIIIFLRLFLLKHWKLFLKNIIGALYRLNKNYKKINCNGEMKKVNNIIKIRKMMILHFRILIQDK